MNASVENKQSSHKPGSAPHLKDDPVSHFMIWEEWWPQLPEVLATCMELEERKPSRDTLRREFNKLQPVQLELTKRVALKFVHAYEKDLKDVKVVKWHRKFLLAMLEAESNEEAEKACEKTFQQVKADFDEELLKKAASAELAAEKAQYDENDGTREEELSADDDDERTEVANDPRKRGKQSNRSNDRKFKRGRTETRRKKAAAGAELFAPDD